MFNFVEKHNLLYANQFGFRPHHSTELAVIKLIDTISTALDQNKYTCSVALDFRKAFDTLDLNILLCKLQYYRFRSIPFNYLSLYLHSRSQYVFINSTRSNVLPVTHGVPQGSILGPFLFLIYINDISKVMPDTEPIFC